MNFKLLRSVFIYYYYWLDFLRTTVPLYHLPPSRWLEQYMYSNVSQPKIEITLTRIRGDQKKKYLR